MSQSIGMIIDCVVAILLVLTIGYCMILNRRLKLLKADEQSLRATISELVTATEIAERAIGGLKVTVHECDMGLGERLRKAERLSIEIDRAVVSGKDLVSRLSQIVSAGRRGDEAAAIGETAVRETLARETSARESSARETWRSETKASPKEDARWVETKSGAAKSDSKAAAKTESRIDPRAVAAAAQAFAERLRTKVHGLAA